MTSSKPCDFGPEGWCMTHHMACAQSTDPAAYLHEAAGWLAREIEKPLKAAQDERQWRKERPVCTGVLDYFPDALLEVANTSFVGNEQHNPGTALHWDKSKSKDEPDALVRHLMQRGTRDSDGVRHSAKVAWRALALLQREIDAEREAAVAAASPVA